MPVTVTDTPKSTLSPKEMSQMIYGNLQTAQKAKRMNNGATFIMVLINKGIRLNTRVQ